MKDDSSKGKYVSNRCLRRTVDKILRNSYRLPDVTYTNEYADKFRLERTWKLKCMYKKKIPNKSGAIKNTRMVQNLWGIATGGIFFFFSTVLCVPLACA